MCCDTLAPIKDVKFFVNTTNSTEYFWRFWGFVSIIFVVPNGMTSVLFHMMRVFGVGAKLQLPTSSFDVMFIDDPQSTWTSMGLLSFGISERSPWEGGLYQMVRQNIHLPFPLLYQLCSRYLHCRPLTLRERESLSKKCCLRAFKISCTWMQSDFSHHIDAHLWPHAGHFPFSADEFLHRRGRIFVTCRSCRLEDSMVLGFPLLDWHLLMSFCLR